MGNGLVETSKNCIGSTSKNGPWKRINTGTVQNNINRVHNNSTTNPSPVAMPARKRVQPQNKSKFNYLLYISYLYIMNKR
jgi:hypothetical protein